MSNRDSVLDLFRRGGHGTEISVNTLSLLCGLSFDETDEIVAGLRREGVLAIGPHGGIAPVAGFKFETIEEGRARRLAAKEERKARRRADKARSDVAREERIASLESRIRGGKAYCTCGAELKYGGTTCRPCFLAKASANQIAKREADVAARREARLKKAEARKIAHARRAAEQAANRAKPKRHHEQPMPRVRMAPPPAPSSVLTADPWAAIRARTYSKPPLVEGALRPLTKFEMMTGRRERTL